MQAVVVAGPVTKQQRGRPRLPGLVTAGEKARQCRRIAGRDAQLLIPAIGDRREVGVQPLAEVLQKRGQRVPEVLVLAAPESMSAHDHPAAEMTLFGVKSGQLPALARTQQAVY